MEALLGVEMRMSRAQPALSESEVAFQESDVYMCLLVNRTQRSLRVIDFRSGASAGKKRLILDYARQHGIERVFTLVEREELGGWGRLGFGREGTIPAFYKRSDAYLLGALVEQVGQPNQSGTRRALATKSERAAKSDRLYKQCRSIARSLKPDSPGVRVSLAKPVDAERARVSARRAGKLLTNFEPFSRDAVRWELLSGARGGFSLLASVESQPCFDNAYIELLSAPSSERETQLTAQAVAGICRQLEQRAIVGCFATTPAPEVGLGAVYLANGFRRTGILHDHLLLSDRRTDAFLWSRKLAQPGEP